MTEKYAQDKIKEINAAGKASDEQQPIRFLLALTQLKDALKAFRGVKIIDSVNNAYASVKEQEEIPNAVTLAAMKEIKSGKDAGSVCMYNLESFIASMQ